MKTSRLAVTKKDLTFFGLLGVLVRSVWVHFKGILLLLILVSACSAVFQIAAPKIFQQIIDYLIKGGFELSQFTKLVLIAGGFMLFGALFQFLADKLSFYIATQIEDRWRYTGLLKFYTLPMKWQDQHDSGEIGSKLDRGGSAIFSVLYEIFGRSFTVSFVTLIFVLIYTGYVFPQFLAILLIPLPIYLFVTYISSRKIAAMQLKLNRMVHDANRTWYDGVGNLRYVKTFGREYAETEEYANKWDDFHVYEYTVERAWLAQSFVQNLIEVVTRAVLLVFAAKSVLAGSITVGQVVLLVSFQQLTFSPLQQLNSLFTRIRRVATRMQHLFKIIAEDDSLKDVSNAVTLGPLKKGITVESIQFKYGKKIHSLKNISLSIKPGTTTALVGRSGAGKTTLAMLLLRFYDPDSGRILWDDVDIRNASRKSLRSCVTLILQDTTLFNRTITENIRYGNPKATQKQVEEAAHLAHAHEFIKELPKGYNSVVGERGVRLSGGQRQRITIARALLIQPELLVMDEATSHLDAETEAAIKEAIKRLHGKHTQVIIAHRLSTVQHADNIVLMDKGRIVAQGKHKTLLKNPLYRKLCRLQLQ